MKPAIALAPPTLVGRVDRVEDGDMVGWAYDDCRPDDPVSVLLRAAGVTIGTGLADLPREDLKRAGYGNGAHGFRIRADVPFSGGEIVDVQLFEERSGAAIATTPFSLHCHNPVCLSQQELGARSIHGRKSAHLVSRQRDWLRLAVSPFIKTLKRLHKRPRVHELPKLPVVRKAYGAEAKLARLDTPSANTRAGADNWPRLTLPVFNASDSGRPRVSVIIPVHDQFHLTYQCLVSLILSGDKADTEVIVVDDASTDNTTRIESRVRNLRVVRNNQNLGFLHSCNKAAARAQGDFLVFLNNDTEVEAGWIDSMLEVFAEFSNVGAVGARLIYPDGSLQDAGGIVWNSGTPWNVGHGQSRDNPEFSYVREVDYLTGAALMVSRRAWEAVEGFSPEYAPAYYEDTDLAFKLREAGYRTFICPQANVIHYEGRSHGTDTSSGVKRHQVINAERFKVKWNHRFVGQGAEGVDLRYHKDRNRGLRVLVVDNAFPRLGQNAGSYAAVQEMRLLLALGCKVTFLPNNMQHLGIHVEYLQRLGVECVFSPFHDTVAAFIGQRGSEFDVVYVTRYAVAEKIIPLVRRHSQAKVIFNNADLHFFRELRIALSDGQQDLSSVERTRYRELAVMEAADVVLSYSDIELEIISSHLLRRDKLFRCPWVVTPQASDKSWGERCGLAFVGGFAHTPNTQAIEWFLRNVMPELHGRRPDLRLNIWGSHIPPDNNWHRYPGVVVHGYAQSLDDVFSESLAFIAPLQAGAGIKGKVLDSLAYAVPTILSPIAAEATGLIDGSSTLIAHHPAQWIAHIESLIDNELLWQRIRSNAVSLRDRHYSMEAGVQAMRAVFDYLELRTDVLPQQAALRTSHSPQAYWPQRAERSSCSKTD